MTRTACRRSVALLGTAFAIVAVLAACSGDPTPRNRPVSAPPPEFTKSGTVPVPDLDDRQGPAVAWTGQELFVFGGFESVVDGTSSGRRLLRDGALVRVETGAADELPAAPFAAPLLYPVAVRSGDAVVVVGIECDDYRAEEDSDAYSCAKDSGRFALASFDPRAPRWSKVSRLPNLDDARSEARWAPGRTEPGFWIPQVLGSDSGRTVVTIKGRSSYELWSHTPTTGSLTPLPSFGVSSNLCVTGNHIAGMGETGNLVVGSGGVITIDGTPEAALAPLHILDLVAPEPTWVATPPVELAPGMAPDLTCLGSRVMMAPRYGDQGTSGRLFDIATATWTDVAAPPTNLMTAPDGRSFSMPFTGSPEQRVWTGAELLQLTDFAVAAGSPRAAGRAFDPVANTWRVLPPLPARLALPQWTGSAVVGYSTDGDKSVAVHYLPT